MSFAKFMEKSFLQLVIFDFLHPYFIKITCLRVYEKNCFCTKNTSGFFEFTKMSFFLVFQLLDGYTTVGSLINSIIVVQLQFFAVNQNIIKMAPYSKNVVYYACHIF